MSENQENGMKLSYSLIRLLFRTLAQERVHRDEMGGGGVSVTVIDADWLGMHLGHFCFRTGRVVSSGSE